MDIRSTLRKYMPWSQVDEFGEWAFGPDWEEFILPTHLVGAWNKLHGDEYHISHFRSIGYDIETMVEIWEEFKQVKEEELDKFKENRGIFYDSSDE